MALSSSAGRRLYALSLHIRSRPDYTPCTCIDTRMNTCTAAGEAANITTPDVVAFKTLKGGGAALKLHIYTPPGHSPATDARPVVILVVITGAFLKKHMEDVSRPHVRTIIYVTLCLYDIGSNLFQQNTGLCEKLMRLRP